MKIRTRLSVSFSLAAIGVLLLFAFAVYFFSSYYRKNEFNNRLKERIEIVEKVFLEKDNFSADDYTLIREQFLNKLPDEQEEVILMGSGTEQKLAERYPGDFLSELFGSGEAFFDDREKQGVGKIFHINGKDYVIILSAVDAVGIRMMEHLTTVIVVVLAICVAALTLIGSLISGSLINPITLKIRSANSISANNLHTRLAVINPDNELGELAIAFNKLLDRVEHAFETQRLFVDNASHEIRNPLTAIIGETDFALEKVRSTEEYIASLRSIEYEADRLNKLVNDLLQLAGISQKEVSFSRETISLWEILVAARRKLDIQCPENKVQIEGEGAAEAGICVEGNRHLLITAFFNLMDNASKFSHFGPVTVTVSTIADHTVLVLVEDMGIGISEDDLRKIRVPFHRAANVRQIKGTGIGIPLTSKIIELHQGSLEFESKLDEGTCVTVSLPLVNRPAVDSNRILIPV